MKNSDLPAMPQSNDVLVAAFLDAFKCAPNGLTKREHFAGLAMQGFIAAGVMGMPNASEIAELSIKYAEEVLQQLGE